LQEGEPQLAAEMLCDAFGYSWLLHAHYEEEAVGDSCQESAEDGGTLCRWENQRPQGHLGRRSGHGLCCMADGDYRDAESERELHHLWQSVRLGWSGPCQIDATLGGLSWPSYRQPNQSAFLECLSECVRPVHEARIEMQVLWQVCGRCGHHQCRQREAAKSGAKNQAVLERGTWFRLTHGEAGAERGSSRRRVLGSLYQALEDVYIEPCFRPCQVKDSCVRLLKALEGATFCKLLFRNIQAYEIVRSEQEAADDTTHLAHRHLRQGYGQDNRQTFIL
jgi:hypothetical protein